MLRLARTLALIGAVLATIGASNRVTLSAAALDQADFVFEGRVLRIQSSNLSVLKNLTQDTLIVQVIRVLRFTGAPETLDGQEITVRVANTRDFAEHASYFFAAREWLRAENLAVVEIEHELVQKQRPSNAARFIGVVTAMQQTATAQTATVEVVGVDGSAQAKVNLEGETVVVSVPRGTISSDGESLTLQTSHSGSDVISARSVAATEYLLLQARIAALVSQKRESTIRENAIRSDAVIFGTVTSVQAAQGADLPPGEHTPGFLRARLNVTKILRGMLASSTTADVYFVSSDDVRWINAPRLTPGETGVFFLHDGASSGIEGIPQGALLVYKGDDVFAGVDLATVAHAIQSIPTR
jgi:hypothetical protein